MLVWIVGKVDIENSRNWEFQGVFDSEEKAVQACGGENWFVGPAIMNDSVTGESCNWPGAFFPNKTFPE